MRKASVLMVLFMLVTINAFAQETEVSNDDLKGYAALILKVDNMKAEAKSSFSEMVKSHELMDKGRRYNAIKKAFGDEAKLAEIEATEDEVKAYEELVAKQGEASANIKTVLSTDVKEGIGAKMYNIIKKKIKTDGEFKAKYEETYASLKAEMESTLEEEAN